MKTGLFIPVYNQEKDIQRQVESIRAQNEPPHEICVVDSSTRPLDLAPYAKLGAEVRSIKNSEFDHGATRNLALEVFSDCDLVLYLTQDAILATPNSLSHLIRSFDRPEVTLAYGRQLPHPEADAISSHARLFNYPSVSRIKSKEDKTLLGMKTPFVSNSFSAYRMSSLKDVQGFPHGVILGEDMYVAARMLLSGGSVAYVSEATVFHSHQYSIMEEFCRYFDIGVFHNREDWIRSEFGAVEGEGRRFVISELRYLMHNAPWRIPDSLIRTIAKYCGYKLGQQEKLFTPDLKKQLSMNKGYWDAMI